MSTNSKFYAAFCAVFFLIASSYNQAAEVVADWGVIATPIQSETSFSFAQYDLTQNFTHLYSFSLQGDAGATYAVSFNFSTCDHGCGNPDLNYGIYLANGGLVDANNGSVMLSSGNYTFEVKSTGMGAGNSIDYWGNVTFSLAAGNQVSPAPEPAVWVLFGLVLMVWVVKRLSSRIRNAYFICLIPLVMLLNGCDAQRPSGQVLAKVDHHEITLAQLNYHLQRSGISQPSVQVQDELTQKLIDRELIVQQALVDKLDQRPEILLRLEEARREVLAQAYAEQINQRAEKPTENQAAQYYQQHPELFAQRKIYHLKEIALAVQLPQLAQVKQQLQARLPVPQILDELAKQGSRFNQQMVIRAAEQLPIETLPRLQQAEIGETVIFESSRGVMLYQVVDKRDAPMDWQTAQPILRDYLLKQASKRAMDSELKHLRQHRAIQLNQNHRLQS